MNTTIALITAIISFLGAVGSFLYNQNSIQREKEKLRRELAIQHKEELTQQAAAQTAAQVAIYTASEKLAQTSFLYVHHLQTELEGLQKRYADERAASQREIKRLQARVEELEIKVDELEAGEDK